MYSKRNFVTIQCDEIVAEIFVAALRARPVIEPAATTRSSLRCLAPFTALFSVTCLRYVVDAFAPGRDLRRASPSDVRGAGVLELVT